MLVDLKEELVAFRRTNKDVFAWSPTSMPSIPLKVITTDLAMTLESNLLNKGEGILLHDKR